MPFRPSQAESLLAWTTTPWTLPSNLALCVNAAMLYVRVKDVASGDIYILMEKRHCPLVGRGLLVSATAHHPGLLGRDLARLWAALRTRDAPLSCAGPGGRLRWP